MSRGPNRAEIANRLAARLGEIERDERYRSGLKHPATVQVNAPLALIQTSLEAEHGALSWALGMVRHSLGWPIGKGSQKVPARRGK